MRSARVSVPSILTVRAGAVRDAPDVQPVRGQSARKAGTAWGGGEPHLEGVTQVVVGTRGWGGADLEREEFGRRIGHSAATAASYEQGRRIPSPATIERADEVLDAGGLLTVRKEQVERARYPVFLPGMAALEKGAIERLSYDTPVVTGVLQAEECMRVVPAMRRPSPDQETTEQRVAAPSAARHGIIRSQALTLRESPEFIERLLGELWTPLGPRPSRPTSAGSGAATAERRAATASRSRPTPEPCASGTPRPRPALPSGCHVRRGRGSSGRLDGRISSESPAARADTDPACRTRSLLDGP
ncbi:transcriptional regulator with XRE-family HTH domain [Streptomyces sp. V3I8]|nr:transcriptional regulator with XRE-family HTH domain [Streptomyces sp. V3I8]